MAGGTSRMSAHTVPYRGWLCMAQPTPLAACAARGAGEYRGGPATPPRPRLPVEVDADDLAGPQLVPGHQPRIAQQGAVTQVVP